jgi:hypothetical protein
LPNGSDGSTPVSTDFAADTASASGNAVTTMTCICDNASPLVRHKHLGRRLGL